MTSLDRLLAHVQRKRDDVAIIAGFAPTKQTQDVADAALRALDSVITDIKYLQRQEQ